MNSKIQQRSGGSIRSRDAQRGEDIVIIIRDKKIIRLVDEILKRTGFSSAQEYFELRVKSDLERVIKNKKLLQDHQSMIVTNTAPSLQKEHIYLQD